MVSLIKILFIFLCVVMDALFIISPSEFRDEELFFTREKLNALGISSEVTSTIKGNAKGMLGGAVKILKTINELNPADYSLIIFVGGGGISKYKLDENKLFHAFAIKSIKLGKVVAAICAGPRVLARAGVLVGKKATVFPSEENINILLEAGADFIPSKVVVDGKIITANGPHVIDEFVEAIFSVLKK